ncbi:PPOX class probable F420-dependent enzyme, Rv0121 family [Nakamurella panacisegetis]|uniref:PPOX class probable F420-dependent enzyme, Rv0121 family n=1 Tax=Nakamurella panacisegetis TaxID=1090615 RepID=A0A1H0MHX5_9ACTN|nr:TIGR03668 family PPOX class F420-dependent oxidoreductase [Nakamurella panacisegetis]SDO80012.1 PPOX class probable F420-dependent enzyme, Rv0121 family [Nakamurella panacisegetis]
MPRLPTDLARTRLAAARRAVLGTVDRTGAPHLVPVTFVLLDDGIAFAIDHKPKSTTALRRLENIAVHPRVSFLVEHYDDDWERLWWVRADAEATAGTAENDLAAVDALAAKYPQYQDVRPTGVVVRSRILTLVGWSASGHDTT